VPIPETAHQIVVLVVLVLPGVVYAAVRSAVRGFRPHEQGPSANILQAAVVGVFLNAVYVLLFGNWIMRQIRTSSDAIEHPRLLALALLVLSIGVPAGLAFWQHGKPRWERVNSRSERWAKLLKRVRVPKATTGYETIPTAWDKIAPARGGC
jgi:hypothetical protein